MAGEPRERTGGPWRALRSPAYRLYFTGQVVSQAGSWMQRTAQAWLVLDLTGSPVALGGLMVCQFGPILALSLVAGVLADRVPRLPLLRALQVLAGLQALALAALVLSGVVALWHLYALALVLGTVAAFDMPARHALVVDLVDRERLQSAIGLNSIVFNGARVVGPALGGAIVATWGAGWCFALNAATYLVAIACLARIHLAEAEQRAQRQHRPRGPLWSEVADGVRYAARRPTLAVPLALLGVIGLFGFNFTVTLPLLARYALNVDATAFGLMNAAIGLGALPGALGVASRAQPSMRTVLLAGTGFSACLLSVALSTWYPLTLSVLALMGMLTSTYGATTNAILQFNSPDDYRGRVLSLHTLMFVGSAPLGGALTGALADALGVRVTLLLEGGVCLLALVAASLALRRTADSGRATSNP